MLSEALNTNQVKNAAGTEVEFTYQRSNDRMVLFAQTGEQFNLPHRLQVSHQEIGAGMKRRRRSLVRVDKTILSPVDNVTPITVTAYIVMDIPVGAMTVSTEAANVLAEVLSFTASDGSGTTILYDGTGTGAKCLISGSL